MSTIIAGICLTASMGIARNFSLASVVVLVFMWTIMIVTGYVYITKKKNQNDE